MTDDNKDLDAYCLKWHNQPFVFLSHAKSAERTRFNAAHELGHLVLHGEGQTPHGPEAEQEANQFAAAFLMPRAGVLAQGLTNASVNRVLVAKQRWNVAAMAMAHRANELGLMTEWAYRSLCVDLSRRGYRRGEPHGMPHESSQLLTKVLQQYMQRRRGGTDVFTESQRAAVKVSPADRVQTAPYPDVQGLAVLSDTGADQGQPARVPVDLLAGLGRDPGDDVPPQPNRVLVQDAGTARRSEPAFGLAQQAAPLRLLPQRRDRWGQVLRLPLPIQ